MCPRAKRRLGPVLAVFLSGAACSSQTTEPTAGEAPSTGVQRSDSLTNGQCGTPAATREEIARVNGAIESYNADRSWTANEELIALFEPVTIPVWVHELRTTNGTGTLTAAQINAMITRMNNQFAGSNFSFMLAGTTTTTNNDWFNQGAPQAARMQLRQGGPETLNIYSVANNLMNSGLSSFPWDYVRNSVMDGLYLAFTEIQNVTTQSAESTPTHEAGHWLGLWHVFQGGCNDQNADQISDTPPVVEPRPGNCNVADTCPGGGADLINNFMDYTPDACHTAFTAAQIGRMQTLWNIYRAPGATPLYRQDILLTGGSPWGSIPVAASTGNGTFSVTNNWVGTQFADRSAISPTRLIWDMDADGRDDVVAIGASGVNDIAIAHSNNDGGFDVRFVAPNSNFAGWAAQTGTYRFAGRFNLDATAGDLALLGPNSSVGTFRFALGTGRGTFAVTEPGENAGSHLTASQFNGLVAVSGAVALKGDFDGNLIEDIAVVGGSGWQTIPVALLRQPSEWTVLVDTRNWGNSAFAGWAANIQTLKFAGRFDSGKTSDILLLGPDSSVNRFRVAYGGANGVFGVLEQDVLEGSHLNASQFNSLAKTAGVSVFIRDFDGDGIDDVALVGGAGWQSIPVAFFKATGGVLTRNFTLPFNFGGWASEAGAVRVAGFFNNDNRADIALIGGSTQDVRVAFADGGGGWVVTGSTIGDANNPFNTWAKVTGVSAHAGEIRTAP
jgi:hypothetical protein